MNIIKIFLLILFLSEYAYTQAEYQILTSSKNIFQLSANGASLAISNENNYMNPASLKIQDNKYGFSIINYPADIKLYNFNLKNYSLSLLDFGQLKDQIDDTVNKTFSAQEILLKYYYNYKVRNLTFGASLGGFNSNIYTYNSYGLIVSMGFIGEYNKIKSSFGLSIENLGYIIKSYTAFNLPTPLLYRFSFNHVRESFIIGYDLVYSKNDRDYKHIICFQFHINEKIKFRFSDSNYLSNLQVDNNDYNFLSGFAMGLDVELKSIMFDVGFINLGIAGPAYGISIKFLKN